MITKNYLFWFIQYMPKKTLNILIMITHYRNAFSRFESHNIIEHNFTYRSSQMLIAQQSLSVQLTADRYSACGDFPIVRGGGKGREISYCKQIAIAERSNLSRFHGNRVKKRTFPILSKMENNLNIMICIPFPPPPKKTK